MKCLDQIDSLVLMVEGVYPHLTKDLLNLRAQIVLDIAAIKQSAQIVQESGPHIVMPEEIE